MGHIPGLVRRAGESVSVYARVCGGISRAGLERQLLAIAVDLVEAIAGGPTVLRVHFEVRLAM